MAHIQNRRPSGGVRIRYSRSPEFRDLLRAEGKTPAEITRDLKKVPHRWQAWLQVWDPRAQKRMTVNRTFDTKAAAQAWLDQERATAQRDPHSVIHSSSPNLTFNEFLDQWFARVIDPSKLAANSKISYRYSAKHLRDALGSVPIKALSTDDFLTLYQRLSEERSRDTLRLVRLTAKKSLNSAVEWGLIATNPAISIPLPSPQRKEPPAVLSLSEVHTLISVIEADRLKNLWLVILLTGLRRGESLGLQWNDIDWAQNTLRIQRAIVDPHREVSLPKTAHGQRVLSLSPAIVRALNDQRTRQETDRRLWASHWGNDDTPFIFTTRYGRVLSPRAVLRRFKELLEKAGLSKDLKIHSLRHTVATHMIASGTPVQVVSQLLGHANIGITLQLYAHVLPGMGAAAMAQWEGQAMTSGASSVPAKSEGKEEKQGES